jgi:threonine dehydratase
VSDDEILQSMVWMLDKAHTLVEGAGAAPLAAAYKLRPQLKNQKVALVCSGGNASLKHLKMALDSIKD